MDWLKLLPVIAFLASALFTFVQSRRQSREEERLEHLRGQYLAQGILERSHFLQDLQSEEAVAKLAQVIEDIDSEWHWQYQEDLKPGKLDILSSYIGNVPGRTAKV